MAKSLKAAAKNFSNQGRWDDPIKDALFSIPTKNTRVRFYDTIITVRSHWIEFYSEKKKGMTGYAELCLNWDPTTDDDTDRGCPMCAQGMKYTEHHYAYLIDRGAQKKSGNTVVRPVRLTNKLASAIVKLSEMVYPDDDDAPDATDQKGGFDVFLRQENNNNKVDYVCGHSDKSPLTKEERAAFAEYVSEYNVAELAKPRPKKEVEDKLTRFKVIEGGAGGSGGKPDARKQQPKRNYDEYDQEQVPGDDDGDPAAPPSKAGKKPEKPIPKRTSISADDGDEDDGKGKNRKLPWSEDEEDEEGGPSRSYSTPDAEDAPDDEE
jgi:hypothetical protein